MGDQLCRRCSNNLLYCGEQFKLKVFPTIQVVMPSKMQVKFFGDFRSIFCLGVYDNLLLTGQRAQKTEGYLIQRNSKHCLCMVVSKVP